MTTPLAPRNKARPRASANLPPPEETPFFLTTYSVPRRFSLATIMVMMAAYGVLLTGLTSLLAPPAAIGGISAFICLIAVAQAVLFGGKRPRLSSCLVGGVLGLASGIAALVALITENGGDYAYFSRGLREVLAATAPFVGTAVGIGLGYIAGGLVGGIFLVMSAVDDLIKARRRTSDSHNPKEALPSCPLDRPDVED